MGGTRAFVASTVALLALVACNAMSGAERLNTDDDDVIELPPRKDDATPQEEEPIAHERAKPDGGSSPPTQTDAGFDAATSSPVAFTDPFDRPNGGTIGNGWLEKTDRFSLSDGAVLQTAKGSFTNLIVYRPETVLDAQVAVTVTYGEDYDSDPSLHLRMQPESEQTNELVSYTFFAYRDYAGIDREDPGDEWAELASATISPELEIGKPYRMVFRVTGTDPVKVEGMVLHADGTPAATLTANDASDKRIKSAGKIGFGSSDAVGTRWDDFERTDL